MPERLILNDTRIVQLVERPGEECVTQVLRIRALLDRTLARQLNCHDNCFAENEMPRRFVDLKLKGLEIEACGVYLDGQEMLAETVSSFVVGRPSEETSTDPSLEISCDIHFSGAQLSTWMHRRNQVEFAAELHPPTSWNAQLNMFNPADPDAQGDAVASNAEATGRAYRATRGTVDVREDDGVTTLDIDD